MTPKEKHGNLTPSNKNDENSLKEIEGILSDKQAKKLKEHILTIRKKAKRNFENLF